MSVQAISWALSVKTGDPSAKIVLLALANYADEKGRCWPAQSTISIQTEQSIDTVQRRLKDLETGGFLVRRERQQQLGKKGGLYYYYLLIPGIGDIPNTEQTMPQFAATSDETIPQNSKSTPQTDPKAHRTAAVQTTILYPSSIKEGDMDLEDKKGSKKLPGSAEFDAWKSYFVKMGPRSMVRELDKRELEGRAFDFLSRWPPDYGKQP